MLLTSFLYSASWSYIQNEHGFVLKSSYTTLYLGKSCDATFPQYGSGKWSWSEDGISVELESKNFSFSHSSLYDDGRCKESSQTTTNSSSHNEKQLKCLALAWGPDVCSQAFSKYAKENIDNINDVNDIIKSPVCATMIANSLGEEVTSEDVAISMITGLADEAGSAGVDSDNYIFKFLGGVAYAYSFAIKAVVYESCMNK
jgi:hypothetical protein